MLAIRKEDQFMPLKPLSFVDSWIEKTAKEIEIKRSRQVARLKKTIDNYRISSKSLADCLKHSLAC